RHLRATQRRLAAYGSPRAPVKAAKAAAAAVSARLQRRVGCLSRAGQFAPLPEFNGGAFVNEMGITSPAEPHEQLVRGEVFPPGVDPTPDPELTQEALDATDAFVRLLAPPRPLPRTLVEQRGVLIFLRIGCASC